LAPILAQPEDDIVAGEEILRNAYDVDVRPFLAVVREEVGAKTDPIGAYRRRRHLKSTAENRQVKLQGAVSWG
jgi:L-rhamnose isomerase